MRSHPLQDPSVTTISSRAFNQDTGGAKRRAAAGPVIITQRGRPSHVLMTFQAFQALSNRHKSIAELFAMPAAAEIDFDFPKLTDRPRDVDFS